MKWTCSSSVQYNNYRTKLDKGGKIIYYRLSGNPETQSEHQKLQKTTRINYDKGHI